MKHGEMGTRTAMCMARRIVTKCPSRSGALLPWLPWAWVGVYPGLWGSSVFDWCKKKRKGEKNPQTTSPYRFARYRFLLDSTFYRPVDSKTNSSSSLNKSVPKHNDSTFLFSSDTWQFHLKSNWSCLWTSASTVGGGWALYWFGLIFVGSTWDRLSIRCRTRDTSHSSRTSAGHEEGSRGCGGAPQTPPPCPVGPLCVITLARGTSHDHIHGPGGNFRGWCRGSCVGSHPEPCAVSTGRNQRVIPVQGGQGVGLFILWCQAPRKGCWDEGLDTSTPVTVFQCSGNSRELQGRAVKGFANRLLGLWQKKCHWY